MFGNNFIEVTDPREREIGIEIIKELEPHNEDLNYREGKEYHEEETVDTLGCFGCACTLDRPDTHTTYCNAIKGRLPVEIYYIVKERIKQENEKNASGAGLAKRRRGKSLRRKQTHRKQTHRKSLRRKQSRGKSLRRKQTRRKSLRRKSLRRK